jgi:hypothetical protein
LSNYVRYNEEIWNGSLQISLYYQASVSDGGRVIAVGFLISMQDYYITFDKNKFADKDKDSTDHIEFTFTPTAQKISQDTIKHRERLQSLSSQKQQTIKENSS